MATNGDDFMNGAPRLVSSGEGISIVREGNGITKREAFAAMAMQGLCADPEYRGCIPEKAVVVADALIAELNKPTETP